MVDLILRGGTLVDGTGAEARLADVAVHDGAIVAVAPSVEGEAAETIDAAGMLVTPGFVDIHTHYDGQATWDGELNPSAGHGVTTLVMGNCGVGFAPVHPGREDWLIQLMEGVEDIPGTALAEGMTWGWETFPEYLDALDGRRFAVDFEHDDGLARRIAVAEFFEQRLLAAHRPRRSRAQCEEGALALAVVEAPTGILRAQAGDHRVTGGDVDLPAPALERRGPGQRDAAQSAHADLADQATGFEATRHRNTGVDQFDAGFEAAHRNA